jgi:electron transfer flavoprotein alpha subunit
MSVLVLVEHDGKSIKDATLAAVTAAGKLGDVHALVAGSNVGDVAQAAAKIASIGKVLVAEGTHLHHELAETMTRSSLPPRPSARTSLRGSPL